MKKRSAKSSKIIKRLFNKMGMTYVELICALALLSLIVMMFTPMLLSSYETLYKAGEKVEAVYDSKVEIEEGLASRTSTNLANISMNFKMNATSLFDSMNVAGRKVVSHFQGELETVFHGARARVDLLSPSIVYDDKSWHDVILQTTGLDWETGDVILFNGSGGNLENMKKGLSSNQILIDIIKPDKTQSTSGGTTVDSQVYNVGDRTGINDGSFVVDSKTKKISLQINGVDFTTSPLKICIYYKNERGVLKTLSDYMYIKPAHIIFAGDTPGSDYYTSAGIEQIDKSEGIGEGAEHKTEYQFNIEGRGMSLHNSKLLNSGPAGKDIIKVVEWIENDEERGFDPYYVLAGTNASVYRMYNLKKQTSSLQSLLGSKNSIDATTDNDYILETGEKIYPSFWSGDISDQYYFRAIENGMGYSNNDDLDNKDCTTGTNYNKFDTKLKYAVMFSGYATKYEYAHQANRRISYVLTEAGNKSFRLAGKKKETSHFRGYTSYWEPYTELKEYNNHWDWVLYNNTEDPRPVYLYAGTGASDHHYDKNFGYLRLKSYTTVDPRTLDKGSSDYIDCFNKGDFWYPNHEDFKTEDKLYKKGQNQENGWLSSAHGNHANITAATYLPGASSTGEGQVVYFGSVPAYAFLRQSSDIEEKVVKIYNNEKVKASKPTVYLLFGSEGVGTTLYKGYDSNTSEAKPVSDKLQTAIYNDVANPNSTSSKSSAADFYNTCSNTVYKYEETDLAFTFGYCSRWRTAIADITFNGTKEEYKSYEKFYKASHYTANGKIADAYYLRNVAINAGGEDNLYYNVWFPGEFYNLTQVATLDEVTVAVGYSVSGSTYMKESAAVGDGYYGTALGSVYNDGVLAAYTHGGTEKFDFGTDVGGQTNILKNLLYYKSPEFTNDTTHSRDSVRFTTVGLNAETSRNTASSDSGKKEYYAYYGDSNGHVYRSLVATSDVTFVEGDDEKDDTTTENVKLVNVIPDTKLPDGIKASKVVNGLEEIKLTGAFNGIAMNKLFKEITAIECSDDLIIITGIPQDVENGNAFGAPFNGFAVGIKDDKGNWEWKVHAMEASGVPGGLLQGSTLDCAKIIGNYLYISGYGNISSRGNECWIAGINLEVFRNLTNGDPVPFAAYSTSDTDTRGMWQNLGASTRIYAIGGHAGS